MPIGTPAFTDASPVPKSRDADNTRQLLLRAARYRFARDGYAATKVRDIAADAGVNMALINRYFVSKEGLFEACLQRVDKELGGESNPDQTLDRIVHTVLTKVTAVEGDDEQLQLLLLLRTSGDERADDIRRGILHSFTERLAATSGWRPDDPSTEPLLLRAQLVIATSLGIVMLRSSIKLEPLSSTSADELAGPLGELLRTMLPRG
jgi:AcrR family transcriptional regulator